MCSIFGPIMDNYQGDLTDILRASSGGAYGGSTSSSEAAAAHHHHDHHWQQFSNSDPMNFSSVLEDPRGNNFGDPFSTMRDPFLHELDMPASAAYFSTTSPAGGLEEAAAGFGGSGGIGVGIGVSGSGCNNISNNTSCVLTQKILEDDMVMRRPASSCKNMFSNMIQISPNNAKLPVSPYDSPAAAMAASGSASPRPIKPSSAGVSGNMINATNTSKDCLVDNTGVQISSPRNPGLKRRKNQAKKVVCIPAPAAANSRQSGEVVPSDLWAWRKYGQKPIKGSPYPRGYYRCSSSKGCSARKQVERSRTDPNMLVITYTSEHNHPWPTQRNALAGSTRSQPSKNNNAASKNNNSETSQPQKGGTTTTKPKEEQQESNSEGNVSPVVAGNSSNSASVKEEMEDCMEKQLEMDDGEFSDGLAYKPSMLQESNQPEDFFAELGEIEADPLDLLFTQGFNAAHDDDDQQREPKALDPFHLFDWSGDTNTNSFEEPKRRL